MNRYPSVVILLHWTMAAGFIFMLASGLYMVNADISKAEQFQLYQTHKSAGVVMLVAILIRIAVKVFASSPELPSAIPAEERKLAKLGHLALYLLLLAIPFAGWIMVSASPFGLPTFVFVDWLKWPHFPGVSKNKSVEEVAKLAHLYLVIIMIAVLLTHIGALFWHKKKQGILLLNRMWW
ncbi:cytochrome b [Alteromonas sediminis]|uniref:Cytochrome b n=1 Tax=Alteromonas sediminis TaxID=2259342 RepID=A0A3N5YAR9_9ALTE|nr:cytochrome b/b6 domain-containing protein [Alteromonas sediminis]RPJ65935.1 cytochrome b [Alteromonas sediminis]